MAFFWPHIQGSQQCCLVAKRPVDLWVQQSVSSDDWGFVLGWQLTRGTGFRTTKTLLIGIYTPLLQRGVKLKGFSIEIVAPGDYCCKGDLDSFQPNLTFMQCNKLPTKFKMTPTWKKVPRLVSFSFQRNWQYRKRTKVAHAFLQNDVEKLNLISWGCHTEMKTHEISLHPTMQLLCI